jgi:Trypsin-like peptidase domain
VQNWKENVRRAAEATCLVIRERREGNRAEVRILGTGFWIAPDVFASTYHIFRHTAASGNVHRPGDTYHLISHSTVLDGPKVTSNVLGERLTPGFDLWLSDVWDLALLKVHDSKIRPHLALAGEPAYMGEEIGIIGYPFAQITPTRNGRELNIDAAKAPAHVLRTHVAAVYHLDHDIGTARFTESQMLSASVLELPVALAYGYCGSPCFDADSGQVVGIGITVMSQPIMAEWLPTEPRLIAQGAPERYVDGSHTYSSHCVNLQLIKEHEWLSREEAARGYRN